MKLVYQYMSIFFAFQIATHHLHPLQVENSRLVVDEDADGNFRLKRVSTLSAELFFSRTMDNKGFFQLEIIINILVSCFRFI